MLAAAAASCADEEAPAERGQLVAFEGDAGSSLQALQLAVTELVQEPQERGDTPPAQRELGVVPVVDVAGGLLLPPVAAAADGAVDRAEDSVRSDGARAVGAAGVHLSHRAVTVTVVGRDRGRDRAASGLHLLEEAAVAVRALYLRLPLRGAHHRGAHVAPVPSGARLLRHCC